MKLLITLLLATGLLAQDNRPLSVPNNTIVLFGASINAQNVATSLTGVTLATPADGFFSWANAMMGTPFTLLNACVPSGCSTTTGQTSSGLVAGSPALYQTQVIAFHPGWVLVGDVLVNDLINGISTATTEANLTTLYNAFHGAGIRMLMLTASPYCDADPCTTNSYTPSDPRFEAINVWIKGFAQNHSGFYVVDNAAAIIDATLSTGFFGPVTGATLDGKHYATLGGFLVGKAIATYFQTVIPQLLPPALSTINYNTDPSTLITNGMMTGTGGTAGAGASGSIATSWTLTGFNGAGCVGSKGTRTDGMGVTQIITMTGTGATSYCDLTQTFTGWTANVDTLQVQAELMSGSSLGGMSPVSICYNAACAAGLYTSLWQDNNGAFWTNTMPYMLSANPPHLVPVSATSAVASIRFYGSSTGGAITVGRVEVHKR